MANKLVTEALRVLRNRKDVRDVPTFLRAIGRSDLADVPWPERLVSSGPFATILFEARRVIARRVAEAEARRRA